MRGVTGLCRRVYHDYLRPDQTTGYEALLRMAVENGYVFETVSSFDQRIREGGVQSQSRYCILRRDVDTNELPTMRRMLQAEVKYGARCSYFFRDITLDIPLVKQITAAGGEVSYHYEEMSAYAFAHRIKCLGRILPLFVKRQVATVQRLRRTGTISTACCIVRMWRFWIAHRLGKAAVLRERLTT